MFENPYTSTSIPSTSTDQASDVPVPGKKKTRWGTVIMLLGIGVVLVALLLPAVRTSRGAARRMQCSNQLKQIALALQTYADTYGAMPPVYTVDAEGRPLHSWRTLILPFFEQQALYEKIDLEKPWDDPANAEALQTAIQGYRCPAADCPENHTTYLAFAAPNGRLRHIASSHFSAQPDGSSTLAVLEAPSDQSIPWMSPHDASEELLMRLAPDSHLPHEGGVLALFADGQVIFLTADLPADQRRAMLTSAEDDAVDEDN